MITFTLHLKIKCSPTLIHLLMSLMLFYHFIPDTLKILNKDLLNHIIFDIFIT